MEYELNAVAGAIHSRGESRGKDYGWYPEWQFGNAFNSSIFKQMKETHRHLIRDVGGETRRIAILHVPKDKKIGFLICDINTNRMDHVYRDILDTVYLEFNAVNEKLIECLATLLIVNEEEYERIALGIVERARQAVNAHKFAFRILSEKGNPTVVHKERKDERIVLKNNKKNRQRCVDFLINSYQDSHKSLLFVSTGRVNIDKIQNYLNEYVFEELCVLTMSSTVENEIDLNTKTSTKGKKNGIIGVVLSTILIGGIFLITSDRKAPDLNELHFIHPQGGKKTVILYEKKLGKVQEIERMGNKFILQLKFNEKMDAQYSPSIKFNETAFTKENGSWTDSEDKYQINFFLPELTDANLPLDFRINVEGAKDKSGNLISPSAMNIRIRGAGVEGRIVENKNSDLIIGKHQFTIKAQAAHGIDEILVNGVPAQKTQTPDYYKVVLNFQEEGDKEMLLEIKDCYGNTTQKIQTIHISPLKQLNPEKFEIFPSNPLHPR